MPDLEKTFNENGGYSWIRKDQHQKEEDEILKCVDCGFTFFEEIKANRFKAESLGTIGMGLRRINAMDFSVYRCLKCSKVYIPEDDGSSVGKQWELFRSMVDVLDPVQTSVEDQQPIKIED